MNEHPRSPVRLVAIAAFVGVIAGSGAAGAQFGKSELFEGNRALAKVSSHLLRARALAAAERSAEDIAAAVPSLRLRDGLPVVAIRLASLTPQLLDTLRGQGLEVDSHSFEYARAYGRLDPADLEKIASLPEVITIQPMPRRATRVGSASNQADVTMNSDDVRTSFGYNGTGVEVGVLSDSFRDIAPQGVVAGTGCNRAVSGTQSQMDGDLPLSVVSLDDGPGGGSDEGRALGELIFDIAPSATFSFHSAFNSPGRFRRRHHRAQELRRRPDRRRRLLDRAGVLPGRHHRPGGAGRGGRRRALLLGRRQRRHVRHQRRLRGLQPGGQHDLPSHRRGFPRLRRR